MTLGLDAAVGDGPQGPDGPEVPVGGASEELPAGWARATLGELGEWFGGGTPSKKRPEFWTDGTIPWLSPKDMGPDVLAATQDLIHESALDASPVKLVPAGSVALVVRSGILEHKVPVTYVPFDVTLNQDMKAVVPHHGIDGRWLAWAIRERERYILENCRKHGTTVASLEVPWLMSTEILVPPHEEQLRIVTEIEQQVVRIEAGETAVRIAKKRVADLVQAIRTKALWPTDGEPNPGDWEWGIVDDVLEGIEAGKSFTCLPRPAEDDEWGVIKVSAMTWGEFRPEENKALPPERVPNSDYEIQSGDILVSRANTVDYVGAPVLVGPTRGKLLLSDKSLRLIPKSNVDPNWLIHVLSSLPVRAYYSESATGTSDSMRNISQKVVRSAKIPIPRSGAVRKKIAQEINDRIALVEGFQPLLAEHEERARSLRASLLKAAFTGALVPQDSADEPASALLDRIRAEQKAKAPRKRAARKPRSTPPGQEELPS
ncbi:restriction endonuclease subunit S [Streptomyces rochei]|uniref:restriction endonuclease subunit S n=1 Tax=Streptomyces rochei TaxID=1928 RepID=UPI0036736DB3